MNIDGKVGAVGFISLLVPSALPIVLLKVDEGTGDLIRGPDGLCIKCKPGRSVIQADVTQAWSYT